MKPRPKIAYSFTILLICFLSANVIENHAQALGSVIIPSGNDSTPGAGSLSPFGGAGERLQTIYNPSEFLDSIPEGGIITEVSLRLDDSVRGEPRAFTIPDLEVRMSTSSKLPLQSSTRFSQNVGNDETIVSPRRSFEFTSTPQEAGANSFDLVIPLTVPFNYDPRNGSLVVDFFNYQSASPFSLRLDGTLLESAQRAISFSGGVDASSDQSAFTYGGIILQLKYTAVPEPRFILLITIGMLFFILKGLKR